MTAIEDGNLDVAFDQALVEGLAALRRAALVEWWRVSPPPYLYPALGLEQQIAEAAAALLAKRNHPAAVARSLARRWPVYRHAVAEIVRAVLSRARAEANRAA